MAGEAVGFWSYVQQDNDGDHGRILALAHDLEEQYRIQTAEMLRLFLDREDIDWGEAWKERIDTAIAGTTFFIPIITPSYFRSPECRRELLKFAREADRLGLGELVMSILWVRVSELEDNPEQSEDEAVRLVAKYNWEDLRAERLEDRDSSAYRKAVAALAEKLAERARRARKVEDMPDALVDFSPSAVAEDEKPGILDSLVTTEEATPVAAGRLQEIGEKIEEINDLLNQTSADLQAATKRGQGMKAALTLTNRLARKMSEPATVINASGRDVRSSSRRA